MQQTILSKWSEARFKFLIFLINNFNSILLLWNKIQTSIRAIHRWKTIAKMGYEWWDKRRPFTWIGIREPWSDKRYSTFDNISSPWPTVKMFSRIDRTAVISPLSLNFSVLGAPKELPPTGKSVTGLKSFPKRKTNVGWPI